MSDELQMESGDDRIPREVVNIRFQKNPSRKLKYLEAEPKILGITQIALAVFVFIFAVLTFYVNDMIRISETACAINSVIIIIAGSLAVAAQNLKYTTLKACLGMQVVACIASVICIVHLSIFLNYFYCWEPDLSSTRTICTNLHICSEAFIGIRKLLMAVQIALSATLAAYCCKVIQCCSPVSNVPIITVNRPQDPQ